MHRFVSSLTAIAVLSAASAVLAESKPDGPIDPLTIDDILQRWELT